MSRVECLRQMMHITAFNKGMSHPDVLAISRKLDEAINEAYNAGKVLKINAKQQLGGSNIKPRQQAVLDFIRGYPGPYSPTIREICAGVGLSSSSTVHRHLIKLEEQGYIVRKPNCPRCIVLTESSI